MLVVSMCSHAAMLVVFNFSLVCCHAAIDIISLVQTLPTGTSAISTVVTLEVTIIV